MKIKIADKIVYDSKDENLKPMMIIFDNEEEKKQVTDMPEGIMRYCIFDKDKMGISEIHDWMDKF